MGALSAPHIDKEVDSMTFYDTYDVIMDALRDDLREQFDDNDIDADVDLPDDVKHLVFLLSEAVNEYTAKVEDEYSEVVYNTEMDY